MPSNDWDDARSGIPADAVSHKSKDVIIGIPPYLSSASQGKHIDLCSCLLEQVCILRQCTVTDAHHPKPTSIEILRDELLCLLQTWMPKLSRSIVVPGTLPIMPVIQEPSKIRLDANTRSRHIQSPTPAQVVLSRLAGHAIMQCSSPLWHASREIDRGLDSRTVASIYSTTQGHPLLIAQASSLLRRSSKQWLMQSISEFQEVEQ